ncbi:hypothetical protein [Bradyrhizobium jicamae]|uniref:hypothetical protein n=1 Tax=Bradyrhizobium jicamae TaxID=280332 RepID=UPI000A8E399B|nr:hypothetical protein [Bradyrhizobium jicamae]
MGLAADFRRFREGGGRVDALLAAGGLPQDAAALYREDKVVDECLEPVAPVSLEVFSSHAQGGVWPLFNGVQIRRNCLKSVSQSPQIGTVFGIHGRHRWKQN